MNKNITDNYWMAIVEQIAKASTCRVEIGTVLVKDNHIVGVGYLGSVSGDYHCCDDDCLLLSNYGIKGSEDNLFSCERTCHAEVNAVLKCKERGSENDGWITCYSTYSPCLQCTKILLQIGVREFIFKKDYKDLYRDQYLSQLNKTIFKQIKWRKYDERT